MKSFIIFITALLVTGCGQRIAGNPSKFSYEQYSDYHGYSEKQVREKEERIKQINPQSTIPNPPLVGEPNTDFNKAVKHRFTGPR